MSIGAGIFMFVVGAILAFALRVEASWIDLQLVGYLLMAGGVVTVLIGLVFLFRRRSAVSTTRSAGDPVSGERVTQRSTTSDDHLV
jgi:membrane-bound ClpP family serine protease